MSVTCAESDCGLRMADCGVVRRKVMGAAILIWPSALICARRYISSIVQFVPSPAAPELPYRGELFPFARFSLVTLDHERYGIFNPACANAQ